MDIKGLKLFCSDWNLPLLIPSKLLRTPRKLKLMGMENHCIAALKDKFTGRGKDLLL